jgi:hypothetical protein
MDDELKAQVIDTINDTYLCELHNKHTGYLGISTCNLFNLLLDGYGKITLAGIEDCKCLMNDPIDSIQPINIYFQKVDGQAVFTPGQILRTAYHTIGTLGYYNDACKEWHKTPKTTKRGKTSNALLQPNIMTSRSNKKSAPPKLTSIGPMQHGTSPRT